LCSNLLYGEVIMAKTLRFVVTAEYDGTKAGKYLRTVCGLSARTLAILKRSEGALLADGKLLRTIDLLKEGSVIEISLPSESNSESIEAIEGDLDILFEDQYLLILNKPSNMPVHPVKLHQRDTLANRIAYRYKGTSSDFVFRAVNRLDRDTTGIVIIAKDRHTASLMQKADVKKYYIAVCHGVTDEFGTVDEPIGLAQESKILRTVTPLGQNAVTHYKRISCNNIASLVELNLETGRTHQIRCHMSYIGHPLFGDDLYGGKLDFIGRQALHCLSVEFVHPFTNEVLNIKANLPDDIKNLITRLELKI